MSSTSPNLVSRILDESEYPPWQAFVDDSPSGSVYSYPEYLETLCRVAGGSYRILAVFAGEELRGGIALYERDGAAGRILSGRLLLYYTGIVLKDFPGKYPSRNTARTLATLEVLERALREEGYAHSEIRNRHPVRDVRPFLAKGWRAQPSYSYIIDIRDLTAAWDRVEQNQRRLVNRCEREGILLTSDPDFPAFFRMHEETHQRKGAPLYLPSAAFERYFRDLNGKGLARLYQARLPNGTPIASQLVLLGKHPVAHTVSAAADPQFLNIGSTPFLRWKCCSLLSDEGYEGVDLTDASLNEVTRFKSALGGDLVTNLVLSRPDRIAYRVLRATRRAYRRVRGLAGGTARRIMGAS